MHTARYVLIMILDIGFYITGLYETFVKNKGLTWAIQQFYGMFVKKAIHTWRNKVVTLTQLILPVVFTILAFLSLQAPGATRGAGPALKLDLAPFDPGSVIVYNKGTSPSADSTRFGELFKDQFPTYQTENADTSDNTLDDYLVSKATSIGISTFNKRYIVAGDFRNNESFVVYFNGQPFHSEAIALSYMITTLLQGFTNSSHSITTYNRPLPLSLSDQSDNANVDASSGGFTVAVLVLFGMAFLSTSFILFLIKERSTGAKHLQKVSGVSSLAYWLSNYCWDMLNYLFAVILMIIVFAAFQYSAYVNDHRLGLVFFVFLIYGLCCLPFVYLLHFMFSTPSTGMTAISMLNIITGKTIKH